MTRKNLIQILIPSLFSVLMLAQPWAMAADDHAHADHTKAQCAAGTTNCPPAAHEHYAAARLAREAACAKDPQSCDSRSQSLRSELSEEYRDRHACRD
jgi:hypothetical protein